jgi:hypothetical protein
MYYAGIPALEAFKLKGGSILITYSSNSRKEAGLKCIKYISNKNKPKKPQPLHQNSYKRKSGTVVGQKERDWMEEKRIC